MKSNQRISELLVETKAYTDLAEPVILTSGELGIYYINTEKLCQDGGEWKEYSNDSKAMIEHAIRMTEEHPAFYEVIEILSDEVEELFDGTEKEHRVVSGGQRRDWLFSGPVANKLGVPHLSLYKQKEEEINRIEVLYPGNLNISWNKSRIVHVADLNTRGSSAYGGDGKGWIPTIRKQGASIKDYMVVVTRLQGAEELLAGLNPPVTAHSLVAIDEDFLKEHSNNPDRAMEYWRNPQEWSKKYLKENGALALVKTFDPDGGKLDRAGKFLNKYGDFLEEVGKVKELEDALKGKFDLSLDEVWNKK